MPTGQDVKTGTVTGQVLMMNNNGSSIPLRTCHDVIAYKRTNIYENCFFLTFILGQQFVCVIAVLNDI